MRNLPKRKAQASLVNTTKQCKSNYCAQGSLQQMTLAVSATEETKASTVIADPWRLHQLSPHSCVNPSLLSPALAPTRAWEQHWQPCQSSAAAPQQNTSLDPRVWCPLLCVHSSPASAAVYSHSTSLMPFPDLHCHALTKGDAVQPRKSMLTALVATSIPTVVPVSCAYLSPQHYLCVCNWTLPLYRTCSCALALTV